MTKKIKKSFRCKCKSGIGMHSEYLKTLTNKRLGRGYLNVPKPYNAAELSMLSKFIFGIELTVTFNQFTDYIENIRNPKYNWITNSKEELNSIRFLKLYLINPDKLDFIPVKYMSSKRSRDNKFVFINLLYHCDQIHDSYYDHKFSMEVFNSSYDVDGAFWRHCIGELYCGGIASCSYGQVETTSYKEYERLLNFKNNPDQSVRDCFREEIEKMIEIDNTYN